MQLTDNRADRTPRKSGEPLPNGLNSIDDLRKELDGYLLEMQDWDSWAPDEVFMRLAAYTARASYIRAQIVRSSSKLWQSFRTGEVDPFINECDRQFKFWSRVQAVNQMDWNVARNAT